VKSPQPSAPTTTREFRRAWIVPRSTRSLPLLSAALLLALGRGTWKTSGVRPERTG
jgi:hypothetical protein